MGTRLVTSWDPPNLAKSWTFGRQLGSTKFGQILDHLWGVWDPTNRPKLGHLADRPRQNPILDRSVTRLVTSWDPPNLAKSWTFGRQLGSTKFGQILDHLWGVWDPTNRPKLGHLADRPGQNPILD